MLLGSILIGYIENVFCYLNLIGLIRINSTRGSKLGNFHSSFQPKFKLM